MFKYAAVEHDPMRAFQSFSKLNSRPRGVEGRCSSGDLQCISTRPWNMNRCELSNRSVNSTAGRGEPKDVVPQETFNVSVRDRGTSNDGRFPIVRKTRQPAAGSRKTLFLRRPSMSQYATVEHQPRLDVQSFINVERRTRATEKRRSSAHLQTPLSHK